MHSGGCGPVDPTMPSFPNHLCICVAVVVGMCVFTLVFVNGYAIVLIPAVLLEIVDPGILQTGFGG